MWFAYFNRCMWWLLGIIFPLLTSRVVCFNGARQGSTTKCRQSRSKDNVRREAVYPYIQQEDPCAALPTSRPYQTCFPLVSTYFHHLYTTTYDVSFQDLLYQHSVEQQTVVGISTDYRQIMTLRVCVYCFFRNINHSVFNQSHPPQQQESSSITSTESLSATVSPTSSAITSIMSPATSAILSPSSSLPCLR